MSVLCFYVFRNAMFDWGNVPFFSVTTFCCLSVYSNSLAIERGCARYLFAPVETPLLSVSWIPSSRWFSWMCACVLWLRRASVQQTMIFYAFAHRPVANGNPPPPPCMHSTSLLISESASRTAHFLPPFQLAASSSFPKQREITVPIKGFLTSSMHRWHWTFPKNYP